MIKVSAVVVWYNPSDEDKKNITSYLDGIDRLYIVDNSESVNKYFNSDKIEYIYNGENFGIAKALNIGCELAIRDGFDWIITMDQDTIFDSSGINKIKDYIMNNDTSNYGIISPWHNTKLHKSKPDQEFDYPLDVMTSGNFLNLEVYLKNGKFKEEYFIDGVDMEYCLRLKKNGYQVLRINSIEILHNLGDIEYKYFLKKELLCLNHNYLRVYYKVRNYNYINKEYGYLYPEFCKRIIKLKQLIWCIIFYEKDKMRKLRSIYYALKDFKKGILGKYNH